VRAGGYPPTTGGGTAAMVCGIAWVGPGSVAWSSFQAWFPLGGESGGGGCRLLGFGKGRDNAIGGGLGISHATRLASRHRCYGLCLPVGVKASKRRLLPWEGEGVVVRKEGDECRCNFGIEREWPQEGRVSILC
jgi:hypothetical protein